jgi:hypothetical protein
MTAAQIKLKKITDHFLPNLHAGMLHRWHTHPHLAGTVDRLDGHQSRVAKIMLKFWPNTSREALILALTHDDGESETGDIPGPIKEKLHWAARCQFEKIEKACIEALWAEAFGKYGPMITATESRRISFADKLDAYMWAEHHAPHIMCQSEWQDAAKWLCGRAHDLGVFNIVEGQQ